MHWAVVVALLAAPWTCSQWATFALSEPARSTISVPSSSPSPSSPRAPEIHPDRTPPPPRPPAKQGINLPEGIVVRALDAVRPSFLQCVARARKLDPLMGSLKVTLHLEIDPAGVVLAASTDVFDTRPRLANCLVAVGRGMTFPAPHEPALVDVPLLF
ncbi:MAG: hypothetical protein NT062_37585 [Proteobacteria bacterium]|nr:hypothetical protein [Pseudomonadota bacterium]